MSYFEELIDLAKAKGANVEEIKKGVFDSAIALDSSVESISKSMLDSIKSVEQSKKEGKVMIHPLKAARHARGISLRGLAMKIRLPFPHGNLQVAQWERGLCAPCLAKAEKIAQVLGFESGEELRRLCKEWKRSKAQ